jgi:hypothetical protein
MVTRLRVPESLHYLAYDTFVDKFDTYETPTHTLNMTLTSLIIMRKMKYLNIITCIRLCQCHILVREPDTV